MRFLILVTCLTAAIANVQDLPKVRYSDDFDEENEDRFYVYDPEQESTSEEDKTTYSYEKEAETPEDRTADVTVPATTLETGGTENTGTDAGIKSRVDTGIGTTAATETSTTDTVISVAEALNDTTQVTTSTTVEADEVTNCNEILEGLIGYPPALRIHIQNDTIDQKLLATLKGILTSISRKPELNRQLFQLMYVGMTIRFVKAVQCVSDYFKILEKQAETVIQGFRYLSQECNATSTWPAIWLELEHKIMDILSNSIEDHVRTKTSEEGAGLQATTEEIHMIATRNCSKSSLVWFSLNYDYSSEEELPKQPPCQKSAFTALNDLLMLMKRNPSQCALKTSPQRMVLDLYTLLVVVDTKTYIISGVSSILDQLDGRGTSGRELKTAEDAFAERVVAKAKVAQDVAKELSNWYTPPPPTTEAENVTFIQFTEVLQGYIVNEVNLNKEDSCRKECKYYQVAQEESCRKGTFCNKKKTRCDKGTLYNCTFFKADFTICTSKEKYRRYDWVYYENNPLNIFGADRLMGQNRCCQRGRDFVESWWRFLYHCSYCMCLCDQPGPQSDRYISLKAAVSDISSGKIVTGVRFVKQGRVVHIQVQEGQALHQAAINESTISWVPVHPITPDDSRKALLNKHTDYATLSWYERAMDLDHLAAPAGHVVTGLRFRRIGGHVNLEMQVVPMNLTTASIESEAAVWIGSDLTPGSSNRRREVELSNSDTPLRSPIKPTNELGSNHYVQFQATSLEKDVGQTTIPFLDAQTVAPQPPTWLSGVALVHRGNPGYGGFVGFKVATYTISPSIPT